MLLKLNHKLISFIMFFIQNQKLYFETVFIYLFVTIFICMLENLLDYKLENEEGYIYYIFAALYSL